MRPSSVISQPLTYRTHKPHKIGVTQSCRRTTAKEYRLKGRTCHVWRIRSRLDLLNEHIDVVMRRLLAREILEEAAVAAFLIAEWDVNVDGTLIRRIGRLRH